MASFGCAALQFCRALLGCALVLGSTDSAADALPAKSTCSSDILVASDDDIHNDLVCEAASRARALMQDCGIEQKRIITIEIVAKMDRSHEACAAYFDCNTDKLTIVDPEGLAASRQVLNAFARLPTDEYFQSVIIHELAHAFLSQSQSAMLSRVGHEYFAYAMQIASLSEYGRNTVLDAVGLEAAPSLAEIDLAALDFGPSKFAVQSFLHFTLPENGCGFIHRIKARDASLPEAFLSRDVGSTIDKP